MAKPYKEGKGWAVRVRCKGQDTYLKGFKTEAAARKAAEEQRVSIAKSGQPARLGPQRTSVALAIQAYAKERLPFLKGARQDAQRLNRYTFLPTRTGGGNSWRLTMYSSVLGEMSRRSHNVVLFSREGTVSWLINDSNQFSEPCIATAIPSVLGPVTFPCLVTK